MAYWAYVFLVLTFPFCIYATWTDLKFLKIPNIVPLGMLAVFVLSGPFVLPWGEYGLSLLYGLIALILSLVLFAARLVPGGDLKFLTAIIPFVDTGQILVFITFASISAILAVITHALFAKLGLIPESWASRNSGKGFKRRFPVGFALAGGLIFYLLAQIIFPAV